MPFLCSFASHHCKTFLQSCKSVSHHCIGRCTAAKWPRIVAKGIYTNAKRPRTIAKRFCSIVSCPCSGAGRNCTAIPPALLVAMKFSCLVKLAGIPHLFRIPCRRLPSLSRQREVCSTGSQAMSPYGARQKPHIADDTALVGSAYVPSSRQRKQAFSALDFWDSCGKVGRRQFF